MARPPRNDLAATELGNRLSELRDAHPDHPTPKDIYRWLVRAHDLDPAIESLRKAHQGLIATMIG